MDEQKNFSALHGWFLTQQGRDVATAFANELYAAQLGDRGQCLLQLGNCGENAWLDGLPYRSKWIAHPGTLSDKSGVQSAMTAMPFDRESMDCIIAPLTIETCGYEKSPLDEIDRILKPMGYVVFFWD